MKSLLIVGACASVALGAHPERAAAVARINSESGILWQAGINERFAASPPGASKSLCGVKPDFAKHLRGLIDAGRALLVKPAPKLSSAPAIPSDFDSATAWPQCAGVIGDIRDQGNCGCCESDRHSSS